MMLAPCNSCKQEYPDHLLYPQMVDGKLSVECPICANKRYNEVHHLPATDPPRGHIANLLYLESLLWVHNQQKGLRHGDGKAKGLA